MQPQQDFFGLYVAGALLSIACGCANTTSNEPSSGRCNRPTTQNTAGSLFTLGRDVFSALEERMAATTPLEFKLMKQIGEGSSGLAMTPFECDICGALSQLDIIPADVTYYELLVTLVAYRYPVHLMPQGVPTGVVSSDLEQHEHLQGCSTERVGSVPDRVARFCSTRLMRARFSDELIQAPRADITMLIWLPGVKTDKDRLPSNTVGTLVLSYEYEDGIWRLASTHFLK